MKKIMFIVAIVFAIVMGCNTKKPVAPSDDKPAVSANDTIRIANEEAGFEIVIFDPAFNSWLNSTARPRSYYTQNFLQARNRTWVSEWNSRVNQPQRYGDLYTMTINYDSRTDYGFEVNYMLYNYLTYFQLKFNQQLAGFVPRI
ncbi:MAG TPA: DUF6146 family protein [Flavobacterium sp.]|jgi:hypothetical protein